MKSLCKILILMFIIGMSCTTVQAQSINTTSADCNAWAAVKSWVVSYMITGIGAGPTGPFAWTISHQGQGTFELNNGSGACPGSLQWMGQDSTSSGNISDVGVAPPPNPSVCTAPLTFTISASVPSPSGGTLLIDPANGTYRLSNFQQLLTGTDTIANCSTVVIPGNGNAWPTDSSIAPCLGFVGPDYPLPSTVQVLEQTGKTFTAPALNSVAGCLISVSWVLSFRITPKNDNVDDQCKKPGNSSVGCQNQSLGEDIPIVDTGFFLHYEGDRLPGAQGSNAVANTDARMNGGWTLNVHHAYDPGTNTLFLGDGAQRSGWQLGSPLTFNGKHLITAEDGSEVYAFDASGRHLQTLKPMTGAIKYQFAYDSSGNLISVTDGDGNVTTIQRNSSGHATAIVSPFLQTTTLTMDTNGFLSQVSDPEGHTVKFTNTTAGLITARTDANGDIYTYTYDTSGKLTKDSDPAGGSITLTRTNSGSNYSVTTTTALGRKSTYQVTNAGAPGEQLTNTWPNGLQASFTKTQQNNQFSEISTLPDGSSDNGTGGPDPRWGIQVPITTSEILTQGNLTMNIGGSRTASLGTVGNPFSLIGQTDKTTVNGRTYTSAFTASNRTFVDTTPVGRTLTRGLDSEERVASIQLGGLLASDFAYDSRGRLSTVTQGTRTTSLTYDIDGRLTTATDPLGLKNSFTYDSDGRVLSTTQADGRIIGYKYDANGNLTAVIPPGKSAHNFDYTSVNLMSEYLPPSVLGTGPTTYSYNSDRDITKITRSDGKTISFAYDNAGRLSSVITPLEAIGYTYGSTTGNLTAASIASGESLSYGYNGPLPTSTSWTGTVNGSVSRAYNNNFWVTSENIDGGNSIAFSYDNDGLVAKAGALTLNRSSQNGLIAGSTLGMATDSRTYNSFGELTGYTASASGAAVYNVTYTRDADGRVSSKTETIGGHTNTYVYSYDLAGRLVGVSKNGTAVSSYSYDTNSNRTKATTTSGTVTGTYDGQDRLLTYGTASYTYTANGELATQTVGVQKTAYQYDVLGNLVSLALPSGKAISYLVDAENRRVGKKVNGVLVEGLLYDDDRVVAQLNGSNAIISQFIYASGATSPDYMVSGSATYRIFSDQLGSPRLVVNTSTGTIVEQISYDEFGNVISDTNPGFQPFGFAGGLYDQDTKLVRFRARDYNPSVGRWTAKDPILFTGEDSNLYSYVLNDPVNAIDSDGTTIFRVTRSQVEREIRKDFGKKRLKACPLRPTKNPKPPKNTPPLPGNPLNWINISMHGFVR